MRGRELHSATHAMAGLPPMERVHALPPAQRPHRALVPGTAGRQQRPCPDAGRPTRSAVRERRPLVHPDLARRPLHRRNGVYRLPYVARRDGGRLLLAGMRASSRSPAKTATARARPSALRADSREHDTAIRESASYGYRIRPGEWVVLTSQERPYSNVFSEDGGAGGASSGAAGSSAARWSPGRPNTDGRPRADRVHRLPLAHARCSATAVTPTMTRAHRMGLHQGRARRRAFSARRRITACSIPFPLALNSAAGSRR